MRTLQSFAFLASVSFAIASALVPQLQDRGDMPPPHKECPPLPAFPSEELVIDVYSSASCDESAYVDTFLGFSYNVQYSCRNDKDFTSMSMNRALLSNEKLELKDGSLGVGIYDQKGVSWENNIGGTGGDALIAGVCKPVPASTSVELKYSKHTC